MKRLFPLACTLLLATAALDAAAAAAPPASPAPAADASAKPSIFVCGDSTSKYSGSETINSDMQGWGTPLALFFDPAKVTVKNVGHAGASSLTYYNGDWPRVLPQIKSGDFVLIVFGINDGGLHTPDGTGDETKEINTRPGSPPVTAHTYGWYMAKMATDAEAKGAHPIFLTVTTRNIWSNPKVKFKDATPIGDLPPDYDPKQDTIERGTGEGRYGKWTEEEGAKLHVPVFDLTNYCADRYEKMGREEVNKLYKDHNHTHAPGARIVAESIVAGLKGLKDSPFTPLLSDAGKAVPPADPKYIQNNTPDTH
ncbi:MAG TPA: GDSL-type esterase/lipase family protein [Phycisphaerae bacterium]|nr:GDSL-type esterase/lipase family protein [Phycisphaerae bacterium]